MEQIFKYMRCIASKQVTMACVNQVCNLSPFVCSQTCQCYRQHKAECQIKSMNQLSKDMLRVMHFQFLVVYSPILKGSSIEVVGRHASQTLSKAKNQQFALTFDPICVQNKLNQIYYKLQSVNACVGVGIFIRETITKNCFKYLPDSQYLNHGAYMLTSNNYLFSSTKEEENCIQSKKINIVQGDVIHVKLINSDNKYKIIFRQQRTGKTEELCLDIRKQLNYHFGVYLYDIGDGVQILNRRI